MNFILLCLFVYCAYEIYATDRKQKEKRERLEREDLEAKKRAIAYLRSIYVEGHRS